jgi:hypothetical protein
VTCWAVEVTFATRRVGEAVLMMAWPVTSRAVFAPASEPGADAHWAPYVAAGSVAGGWRGGAPGGRAGGKPVA